MSSRINLLRSLVQILAPPDMVLDPCIAPGTFERGGDKLVKLAFERQLAPMLHRMLQVRGQQGRLDQTHAEALEAAALLNGDRNRQVRTQMKDLHETLAGQGAKPVFLKGTGVILAGVHSDVSDRLVGDIDVLVAPDHLQDCVQALRDQGYKLAVDDFVAEKFEKSIGLESQHYPAMYHPGQPGVIELHRAFDADNAFEGVRAGQILESAVPGPDGLWHPGAAQMLKMAMLHGLRRGFSERVQTLHLKDIVDMLWILHKYPGCNDVARTGQGLMLEIAQLNDHYLEGLAGVGRRLGTMSDARSARRWRMHCWAFENPGAHRRLNAVLTNVNVPRGLTRLRSFAVSADYRAYALARLKAVFGRNN